METPEYAPQYSPRERIRFVAVAFAAVLVCYGLIEAKLEPWISEFGITAPCREILGINGVAWFWYAIFAGLPASIMLFLGAVLLPSAMRGISARQFPPPGQKVFRRTKIRRGRTAVLLSLMPFVIIIYLAGVTLWGANQAQVMIREFESRDQRCEVLP